MFSFFPMLYNAVLISGTLKRMSESMSSTSQYVCWTCTSNVYMFSIFLPFETKRKYTFIYFCTWRYVMTNIPLCSLVLENVLRFWGTKNKIGMKPILIKN